MSIALDIALAAIVIIAFVRGMKKGFVKSVRKTAALALTVALVSVLKKPALNYLSGTDMARRVSEKISETVRLPQGGGVNIAERLNLPEAMEGVVRESVSKIDIAAGSVNDAVSSSLTGLFMSIIVCVALFVIIRLLIAGVFLIADGFSKLPAVKSVNSFLGGLLGVINIVFIIFLALAFASLFTPADSALFDTINGTYAVKYLYNYNILLRIFMKN